MPTQTTLSQATTTPSTLTQPTPASTTTSATTTPAKPASTAAQTLTPSTAAHANKSRPFYTLYLDIETYSPGEISADALIISVGTLLEVTTKQPRNGNHSNGYHTSRTLKLFSAYHPTTSPGDVSSIARNERKALASFYSYYTRILKEARKNNAILHVVGWNIINYDLPLLYHRLYDYSIDEPDNLFLNLFHYPNIVDLRQIYIFLNQFRLTGSSMSALLQNVYNVDRNSSGAEIVDFVHSGDWAAIDAHLTADLHTISQLHKDLKALSRSPIFITTSHSEISHIASQSRDHINAVHHFTALRPSLR